MSLLRLPNELLYQITHYLDPPHETVALTRTNRLLNTLFTPLLYAHNIECGQSSALSWAASQGHIRTVRHMIKNDADIETTGVKRKGSSSYRHSRSNYMEELTPLGLAVIQGHYEVTVLLAESGANLEIEFPRVAMTPLQIAAFGGKMDIMAYLMRRMIGEGEKLREIPFFELLWDAVSSNHVEVVRFLLDEGANIKVGDEYYCTLVHKAVSIWDYAGSETAVLLIERGADLSAKDGFGATPLHIAVRLGLVDAVKMLLDNGADPNAENEDGESPLDLVHLCENSYRSEISVSLNQARERFSAQRVE